MPIVVKDHERLHDSVIRATLAGGAAAVVATFLPAPIAEAVLVGAIGCAIAPPSSWPSAAWALCWAIAAAAGAKLGGHAGQTIEAAAMGLSLARGVSGSTRWSALGLGMLGALTAILISGAFVTTGALADWPSGLAALLVGATGGFVVGVSSIGRHIVRE